MDRAGAFEIMDASRALAAGFVAFSHLRDLLLVDFTGRALVAPLATGFYFLSGFGHTGVVVFFVLSGFWITKSVVRRSAGPDFWRGYLIDRLSRLWIVLLPALVLGGVLDLIGTRLLDAPVYRGLTGAHSVLSGITAALTPGVFLANLIFLQTLLVPPFGSNSPLWSLAFEFWYYLWFPASWLLLRHRRFSPALLTLPVGLLNPEMYVGFLSWLCGALVYAVIRNGSLDRAARPLRRALLATGSAAFVAALLMARTRASLWFDPLLAAAFGWFLLGICVAGPRPSRRLQPLARYGANSSFSLYAIHYPLAACAAALLAGAARLPFTPGTALMTVGSLAAVVLAGWMFSRATERHTGQLRTKLHAGADLLSRRRRPPNHAPRR